VGLRSDQKSIFKLTTLSFHLAASAHVISVEVDDPDEMIPEVNTFILAVNSKSNYISPGQGRENYDRYKKL
jgi:hypothetical protein